MKEKSLLGEIIHEIYPHSKTDAIYDLGLIAIGIVLCGINVGTIGLNDSILT